MSPKIFNHSTHSILLHIKGHRSGKRQLAVLKLTPGSGFILEPCFLLPKTYLPDRPVRCLWWGMLLLTTACFFVKSWGSVCGVHSRVMSQIRENSLSDVTWCCFFSLNKPAYKEVKFVLLRNQLSQHPWNISLHLIGVSQTDLSPRLVSLCDIKSWFCYSEHAHVVKSCNKRQY